ncbi:MAG: hypothetical protein Q9218_008365 [Villophora microphyllina]
MVNAQLQSRKRPNKGYEGKGYGDKGAKKTIDEEWDDLRREYEEERANMLRNELDKQLKEDGKGEKEGSGKEA